MHSLSVDEKRFIIQRYGALKENLLSILLDLQRACPERRIDEETVKLVARELRMTETKVYEALTFYAMLHSGKQAQFVFEICSSPPCWFNKAQWVADILRRETGVGREEEISRDGLFSFRFVPCFGACAEGPAIRLNDEIYGNLTEESLVVLVKRCRRKKQTVTEMEIAAEPEMRMGTEMELETVFKDGITQV